MSNKLKIYFKPETGKLPVEIPNNESTRLQYERIMSLIGSDILEIRDADQPAPKSGKKGTAVTEVLLEKNKRQEEKIAALEKQLAEAKKKVTAKNVPPPVSNGMVGGKNLTMDNISSK